MHQVAVKLLDALAQRASVCPHSCCWDTLADCPSSCCAESGKQNFGAANARCQLISVFVIFQRQKEIPVEDVNNRDPPPHTQLMYRCDAMMWKTKCASSWVLLKASTFVCLV